MQNYYCIQILAVVKQCFYNYTYIIIYTSVDVYATMHNLQHILWHSLHISSLHVINYVHRVEISLHNQFVAYTAQLQNASPVLAK